MIYGETEESSTAQCMSAAIMPVKAGCCAAARGQGEMPAPDRHDLRPAIHIAPGQQPLHAELSTV